MAIYINNIITELEDSNEVAIEKALKKIKCKKTEILSVHLVKKSVDARHRHAIKFTNTVSIRLQEDEESACEKIAEKDVVYKKNIELNLIKGKEKLSSRPVIVGFGPAGMFAGLILAQNGYCPIIIERGDAVDIRVEKVEQFWKKSQLDENTNVQFGEGGAGTFSDGKLTTRINDERCHYILKELVRLGAPEEILHSAKPHIGTDKLRTVVKNIRNEIGLLGGEVRFLSKMDDIITKNGKLTGIVANGSEIQTDTLILCTGHSARDTFSMLYERGVFIETKAFSVGVRIEHLQSEIDKSLYGDFAGHPNLPVGEYQLSHHAKEKSVYSFCMCPGGVVVASSSEPETVVTNGMSYFARNGKNANSALVVSVDANDYGKNPLDGIAFQQKLEKLAFVHGGKNYKAPAQTVDCFLAKKTGINLGRITPSFSNGVTPVNFSQLLPTQITNMLRVGLQTFEKKIAGFSNADSIMTGIETRTSSPIRITRNEALQSINVAGMYPCGEGAGYAGGIMSAAVDGIRVAQVLIEKYAPIQGK